MQLNRKITELCRQVRNHVLERRSLLTKVDGSRRASKRPKLKPILCFLCLLLFLIEW